MADELKFSGARSHLPKGRESVCYTVVAFKAVGTFLHKRGGRFLVDSRSPLFPHLGKNSDRLTGVEVWSQGILLLTVVWRGPVVLLAVCV